MTAPRLTPPLHHVHPRVGPFSKHGAISLLDGRSREAQFMKRVREELTKCIGNPTAVQRQLIERAVRLSLQLELMDEKLTHGATFKVHEHNYYLAWSNALTRTLGRLGLNGRSSEPASRKSSSNGPETPPSTLHDIAREIVEARGKTP